MEFWRRKKEKEKARKCFLKNGIMFLQELIADCNGKSNPIRMFSSDQICKATNHFDPKCSLPANSSWFTWYKGVIEGRSFAIKRYTKLVVEKEEEMAYNDIVLSARVSNHSGFLKLIGCCLEFPLPVLVFENPEYEFLNGRGSLGCEDAPLLPWNVRLKIAKEVTILRIRYWKMGLIIVRFEVEFMLILGCVLCIAGLLTFNTLYDFLAASFSGNENHLT